MLTYAAQALPQSLQTVPQTKFSDAVCNTQDPMPHTSGTAKKHSLGIKQPFRTAPGVPHYLVDPAG